MYTRTHASYIYINKYTYIYIYIYIYAQPHNNPPHLTPSITPISYLASRPIPIPIHIHIHTSTHVATNHPFRNHIPTTSQSQSHCMNELARRADPLYASGT
ncbi:unnamed protein product [Periconia digitata]|uniref:Uncharacterized protein n=1 Tax=Periconia digitata TaxID=1303443 RepID=A0A9W4UJQ6_9PLEO|nr:unnamed protein product [Periconia digitata]